MPLTEKEKEISGIYEATGYKKDELFNAINVWLAENYNSSKDVIQYSNLKQGVLIGKGNIAYPCDGFSCVAKHDWKIHYTAKIDVKDEKFRLTFDNLQLSWPASHSGGVTSSAYKGPLTKKDDYDLLRPVLLKQGESIKASLHSSVSSDNW